MAKSDFLDQLRALGYQITDLGEDKVSFPYVIPTGRLAEQEIKLGFQIPGDFPATPPRGPHVSPRLLPLQQGGSHPNGAIHASALGPDWEYWSRPISHWPQTKRTVKDVMAHVRHLFDTL